MEDKNPKDEDIKNKKDQKGDQKPDEKGQKPDVQDQKPDETQLEDKGSLEKSVDEKKNLEYMTNQITENTKVMSAVLDFLKKNFGFNGNNSNGTQTKVTNTDGNTNKNEKGSTIIDVDI